MYTDFHKLGESYMQNKGSEVGKQTVGRHRQVLLFRNCQSDLAVCYHHTSVTLRSRDTDQHIPPPHPGQSHTAKVQKRPTQRRDSLCSKWGDLSSDLVSVKCCCGLWGATRRHPAELTQRFWVYIREKLPYVHKELCTGMFISVLHSLH